MAAVLTVLTKNELNVRFVDGNVHFSISQQRKISYLNIMMPCLKETRQLFLVGNMMVF